MRTRDHGRRTRLAVMALLVSVALLASACWENRSRNTVFAGGRFQSFAAGAQGVSGTLLVDSVTGDTWRLKEGRGEDAEWVLVTRGPEDTRAADAHDGRIHAEDD